MDWLIWVAVLIIVGSSVSNVRTKNQIKRALGASPQSAPVKAIEATRKSDGHNLVRTWIVSTSDGKINAGWRWKCSCGVWGVATDTTNRYNVRDKTTSYSLGTEKVAITGFKEHAKQYVEVNSDFYKDKLASLEAEFAEYRKLCYCKDANDALIPWKDK